MSSPPSLQFVSRTLQYYGMNYANISSFPEDYFNNCTVLDRVAIFHTSIRSVPKMDYICNTLTHLVLAENAIVDIQALYNISFPVLRILDLTGNRLASIEPDLMMFPVIHNIMFIENFLTEVPDFVQSGWGRSLPGDDIIYLAIGRGNPWNCTTAMLEKLDGMSSVSPRIEIKNLRDWICHSPPVVSGKNIMDVGEIQT